MDVSTQTHCTYHEPSRSFCDDSFRVPEMHHAFIGTTKSGIKMFSDLPQRVECSTITINNVTKRCSNGDVARVLSMWLKNKMPMIVHVESVRESHVYHFDGVNNGCGKNNSFSKNDREFVKKWC